MNIKNVFVIDMDHTILDTHSLKRELGIVLENNPDISASDIVFHFNNKDKRIEDYIKKNIKKFLFDGVEDEIKKLSNNKNNKLILLSYGLIDFQLLKTKSLSILEYFDEVILTEDDKLKTKTMKKIIDKYKNYNINFINDNLNQNNAMREQFKDIDVKDIDNYDLKKTNDIGNILGFFVKQVVKDIDNLKKIIKSSND